MKQNIYPNANRSAKVETEPFDNQTPDDNMNDMLFVYPNPANDKLVVGYAIKEGYNNGIIGIYDLQSKLIKSVSINKQTGTKTIDISDIVSGNYLITVGNKDIEGYAKQITIKH